MTDIERVIKVIDWLIFEGIAKNRREIASSMGYTESSFSQIVNSKVPLSDKFIKKLSIVSGRINEDWIRTGKGEMLKSEQKASENTQNSDVVTLLKEQLKEEKEKNEVLNKYIGKLENLLEQSGIEYNGIYENLKRGAAAG